MAQKHEQGLERDMNNTIMLGTISLHNMAGGLERNIIYLANYLASTGRKVVLLTFDLPDASSFFDIDPRVLWIKVGVSKPHSSITFMQRYQLLKNIRSAMTHHDISHLVCFSHGLLLRFLPATFGLGIRVICNERNALSMYKFTSYRKWNLNFFLLALVDQITVQFDDYKNDYPLWIRRKITTIHNPVFPPKSYTNLSQKTILAVGRLAKQKRFHLIIEAFALILEKHPEWRLNIVGDGPLKLEMLSLIEELNVGHAVTHHSSTKSVDQHYKTACIFVIASQWEGFPNSLAEALSHGMLAVGLRQTKGVPELVKHDYNGALVHGKITKENLSNAIQSLIRQPHKWNKMSENSREITSRYSHKVWRENWERLLN